MEIFKLQNINNGNTLTFNIALHPTVLLKNNCVLIAAYKDTDQYLIMHTTKKNILVDGHRINKHTEAKHQSLIQYFDDRNILETFRVFIEKDENKLVKKYGKFKDGKNVKILPHHAWLRIEPDKENKCKSKLKIPISENIKEKITDTTNHIKKQPGSLRLLNNNLLFKIKKLEEEIKHQRTLIENQSKYIMVHDNQSDMLIELRNMVFNLLNKDNKSNTISFNLNKFADHCYEEAQACGFHEKEDQENPDLGKYLMNLHGEISELWEAYRRGNLNNPCDKAEKMIANNLEPLTCFEEEVADLQIRIGDLARAFNINLDRVCPIKIKFNRTREKRNGGENC